MLWQKPSLPPDIYPEDGWMLVCRDFGTPQTAPPYPYFMLYNKYRGVLRVFMYNAPTNLHSMYTMELSWRNASSVDPQFSAPMMTFANEAGKNSLKEYDTTQKLVTLGNMKQYWGWGHFDFALVGYDPTADGKPDLALVMNLNGVDVSKVKLQGTMKGTLEQLMEDRPHSASESTVDWDELQKAFEKGADWYKSAKEKQDKFKEAINNPDNKSQWWFSTAQQFAGLATAAWAPYVGAAMGVISQFMGGGSNDAPMMPMNFKANFDIQLYGEIRSEWGITGSGLHMNPSAGAPPAGENRPVQRIPWGVFNVTDRPEMYVQAKYDVYRDDQGTIVEQRLKGYQSKVTSIPSLVVNSGTGMALASVRYAHTHSNQPPSAYVDNPIGVSVASMQVPTGLAYELKFTVPGPKYADPTQVFLKQLPLKITYGPDIITYRRWIGPL